MSVDEIRDALATVIDPELRKPLTELGMVKIYPSQAIPRQ